MNELPTKPRPRGQFINPNTYSAIINPMTGLVQGFVPTTAVKK